MNDTGVFTISLDFELYWGRFDSANLESWRDRILLTREKVIPALLRLFEKYEIHATWATVGFLMNQSRNQLNEHAPLNKPAFDNHDYDAYRCVDSIGDSEVGDPYRLAPSIVQLIGSYGHQEIGTHTYSHFYCLEKGPNRTDFEDDLAAAKRAAKTLFISRELTSIVFPRNQYSDMHLDVCKNLGISAYRGVEPAWYFATSKHLDQSRSKRLFRLLSSIDPFSQFLVCPKKVASAGRPYNISSSQFYRTFSRTTRALHRLHLLKIKRGIARAARDCKIYHLWFHPHNLSTDTEYHLRKLESILQHFEGLRQLHGIRSLNMGEISESIAD